jgi:hypothetical protein
MNDRLDLVTNWQAENHSGDQLGDEKPPLK